MLNILWGGMILLSAIFAIATASPGEWMDAAFSGAQGAVETLLSIAGMMCLWSGLMEIAKRAGVISFLSKLLRPVIALLFPSVKNNRECTDPIVMNISANLMGMSNAATPLGLKAMEALQKENGRSSRPSDEMCRLVLLNTASIQLIPSTLLALRSAAGSSAPSEIIVPVWITSVCALLIGLLFCKLLERKS